MALMVASTILPPDSFTQHMVADLIIAHVLLAYAHDLDLMCRGKEFGNQFLSGGNLSQRVKFIVSVRPNVGFDFLVSLVLDTTPL